MVQMSIPANEVKAWVGDKELWSVIARSLVEKISSVLSQSLIQKACKKWPASAVNQSAVARMNTAIDSKRNMKKRKTQNENLEVTKKEGRKAEEI